MITIGPVGRISTGHVLDVSKAPFERALKDYDPLLYVRWNPTKLKGHGCWEIRRRPEKMSVVDVTEHQGMSIVRLEYAELDVVNHVLDAGFLNYDQLRKIKEMDVFAHYNSTKDYIDQLEAGEDARHKEQLKRAKEEMRHAAKYFKREIRDFREFIASGGNPAQIADHWGKQDS